MVLIEPQLGKLTHLKTTVPHWAGSLTLEIQQHSKGWKVAVELPPGITGELIWRGKKYSLKPGANRWEQL